jgi:hypothetical protein
MRSSRTSGITKFTNYVRRVVKSQKVKIGLVKLCEELLGESKRREKQLSDVVKKMKRAIAMQICFVDIREYWERRIDREKLDEKLAPHAIVTEIGADKAKIEVRDGLGTYIVRSSTIDTTISGLERDKNNYAVWLLVLARRKLLRACGVKMSAK